MVFNWSICLKVNVLTCSECHVTVLSEGSTDGADHQAPVVKVEQFCFMIIVSQYPSISLSSHFLFPCFPLQPHFRVLIAILLFTPPPSQWHQNITMTTMCSPERNWMCPITESCDITTSQCISIHLLPHWPTSQLVEGF